MSEIKEKIIEWRGKIADIDNMDIKGLRRVTNALIQIMGYEHILIENLEARLLQLENSMGRANE